MYVIENEYEIDEFIKRVFNYYNGRINKFNYAELYIDWLSHPSKTIGGLTSIPGKVEVFPRIICRYVNTKKELQYTLLIVIIHELYHIDQIRYMSVCSTNKEYFRMIEDTVEMQTYSYFSANINEIESLFIPNLRSIIDYNKLYELINCAYSNGYLYQRMRYDDYLCCIIDDMIRGSGIDTTQMFEFIRECYSNGTTISIQITNNRTNEQNKCIIRQIIDGNIMELSTKDLNKFLYDNYFQYHYRENIVFNVLGNNNELLLTTSFSGYNYLAMSVVK